MKQLDCTTRNRLRQRGFVLVTALIFMLVLFMLGLSSMQGSTLEERMAGNQRDRNIALQAAEMALRDAERDLSSLQADGITFCPGGVGCTGAAAIRNALERPTDASMRQGFWAMGPIIRQTWTTTCTGGQCWSLDNTSLSKPVWDDTQANWSPQSGSTGSLPTINYGSYTGATAIPGVAEQPRYIMEVFPANTLDVYGTGNTQGLVFRITARAVGQNPNTVVMLQSVYMPL